MVSLKRRFRNGYSILEDGVIIALAGFGYDCSEIGRLLKRTPGAIHHRRYRLGLRVLRDVPSRRLAPAIAKGWLAGRSMRELQEALGVTKGIVAGVIQRRGLMGRKGVGG